jgi:hypothetical protein
MLQVQVYEILHVVLYESQFALTILVSPEYLTNIVPFFVEQSTVSVLGDPSFGIICGLHVTLFSDYFIAVRVKEVVMTNNILCSLLALSFDIYQRRFTRWFCQNHFSSHTHVMAEKWHGRG